MYSEELITCDKSRTPIPGKLTAVSVLDEKRAADWGKLTLKKRPYSDNLWPAVPNRWFHGIPEFQSTHIFFRSPCIACLTASVRPTGVNGFWRNAIPVKTVCFNAW
jgi:hypothetical protein